MSLILVGAICSGVLLIGVVLGGLLVAGVFDGARLARVMGLWLLVYVVLTLTGAYLAQRWWLSMAVLFLNIGTTLNTGRILLGHGRAEPPL